MNSSKVQREIKAKKKFQFSGVENFAVFENIEYSFSIPLDFVLRKKVENGPLLLSFGSECIETMPEQWEKANFGVGNIILKYAGKFNRLGELKSSFDATLRKILSENEYNNFIKATQPKACKVPPNLQFEGKGEKF
ncbi:MAG: hypothetical protein ABUK01_12920 [Leptospirales bacterium]